MEPVLPLSSLSPFFKRGEGGGGSTEVIVVTMTVLQLCLVWGEWEMEGWLLAGKTTRTVTVVIPYTVFVQQWKYIAKTKRIVF